MYPGLASMMEQQRRATRSAREDREATSHPVPSSPLATGLQAPAACTACGAVQPGEDLIWAAEGPVCLSCEGLADAERMARKARLRTVLVAWAILATALADLAVWQGPRDHAGAAFAILTAFAGLVHGGWVLRARWGETVTRSQRALVLAPTLACLAVVALVLSSLA